MHRREDGFYDIVDDRGGQIALLGWRVELDERNDRGREIGSPYPLTLNEIGRVIPMFVNRQLRELIVDTRPGGLTHLRDGPDNGPLCGESLAKNRSMWLTSDDREVNCERCRRAAQLDPPEMPKTRKR